MKVKILGSAAAECMPALFCECDTCKYARAHGGKDVRRRTSYLIDDDILVDFGPDFFWQATEFHIDQLKIRYIFFTHSHLDHLNTSDLVWRKQGYSQISQELNLYGDQAVLDRLHREWPKEEGEDFTEEMLHFKYHVLLPGDLVKTPDLEALALPAYHAPRETPLFYLFSRNGKSILIANDTGFFPEQAWNLLEGRKIHAAILDCTGGIHPSHGRNEHGHMGAFSDEKVRSILLEMGCIAENTPVIMNHFSHNAHSLHHEMVSLMEPRGLKVGYDGMEIDLG